MLLSRRGYFLTGLHRSLRQVLLVAHPEAVPGAAGAPIGRRQRAGVARQDPERTGPLLQHLRGECWRRWPSLLLSPAYIFFKLLTLWTIDR